MGKELEQTRETVGASTMEQLRRQLKPALSERADTTVSKLEEMQAEHKERQTAGHQAQSLRQICIAKSLY